MKKLLYLLSLVLWCSVLSAQQIPNGSFRYWSSYYAPDGWGTWGSAVSSHNSELADSLSRFASRDTMSGDYITDSSTLKLMVDTVTFPSKGRVTLSGFAALGGAFYAPPPAGVGIQFGFMPYTLKPDTLYTDYKFIPATAFNDTAVIAISLTKWDSLTHSRLSILSLSISLGASPQWRRNLAIPLTPYYNPLVFDTIQPDSMQVIIFASVSAAPSLGTALWIDSLHFDASVNPVIIGIPDPAQVQHIAIYPNPADDRLHIALAEREIGSHLRIFNSSGQQVYDGTLGSRYAAIDVGELPSGTYTLRVASPDHLTVYRSLVSIFH